MISEPRCAAPVAEHAGLGVALAGGQQAPPALLRSVFANKLHLVACSLAALWTWSSLLGTPAQAVDYALMALCVAAIYQWNRLTDIAEDGLNCQAEAAAASAAKVKIILGCVSAVALALWLAATADPRRSVALLLSILGAGFAYGSRLPATTFRVKRLLVVKNLVPSLSWSVMVVSLPAPGASLTVARCLALAYVLMAAFAVEIIWDIRDLAGDAAAGIRTLPGRFGAAAAGTVVDGLAAGMAGLVILGVCSAAVPALWLLLLSNSVLVVGWVRRYRQRLPRERFLADLLVLFELLLLLALGAVQHLA